MKERASGESSRPISVTSGLVALLHCIQRDAHNAATPLAGRAKCPIEWTAHSPSQLADVCVSRTRSTLARARKVRLVRRLVRSDLQPNGSEREPEICQIKSAPICICTRGTRCQLNGVRIRRAFGH